MPHSSADPRHWGRGARTALVCGVAVVFLALAFDWNWFRPALEQYLADKSHRSVRIDDFRVGFSWSLDPTFRLRGVRIENAAWADPRPFIVARELTATCTLASLFRKRPVITRLELVDADIDLERQADGLRNWRLTRPDDRGPGIVRVLALEPTRSRIRFVHRGIGLDVQTAAVPLHASVEGGSPLTTKIDFEGTYGGATFSGDALTGRELTFQDTDRFFSIRGHAVFGKTRLDVDGRAADVFRGSRVDVHAALQGSSLALLQPFVLATLPESPPYAGSAQLTKDLGQFTFSEASVKIGSSDVTGTLAFDTASEQRMLRATLRSGVLRLEDLTWAKQLAGAPDRTAPRAEEEPLSNSRIRTLDAELRLDVKRLTMPAPPVSASLALTAKLAHGVLAIVPIDLGLAGGHATGDLTFDANQDRPTARARIEVRGVRIEKLLASLPEKKRVAGAINGSLDLTARGDSLAALLETVSGSIAARMVDGSMSGRLDAELGLSGARFLGTLLGGDNQVPIRCAAADFEFRDGKGRARTMLIETERTSVEGTGTVDLRSAAFDLLLTPRPDRPGLLELRKSIWLRGTPGHVAWSLAQPTSRASGRRCVELKP